MFRKWLAGTRPAVPGHDGTARNPRAEDHLPALIVYLHGAAVATTAALIVALLFLD